MIHRVKKASQSLPPAGGKEILIIFCRGVYLTENTYQAASVRFVRQGRTNRARGRLQSFCQKRAKPFFDSLSPCFRDSRRQGGDISVLFVLHQAERDLFPFGTVEGGVGSLQNLSG